MTAHTRRELLRAAAGAAPGGSMSAAPRVLGLTWLELDYAMLCLDCEVSFDLRAFAQCPKCGHETDVLLVKFLRARRAPALPPGVDGHARVRLAEVLHHAGNGLAPARVHAEFIIGAVDLRGRIGPNFPDKLEQLVARAGRRIVAGIDDTMTRLRALAGPTPTTKESPDAIAQDR
jgi:hypothetical protein